MNKVYSFKHKEFISIPNSENRGFLYGDGFFETIIGNQKELKNIDLHVKRINNAAQNHHLNINLSKKTLLSLLSNIEIPQTDYRVKLCFFREQGGLFSPTSEEALL